MFGRDLALSQISAPLGSDIGPHPLPDLSRKVRVLVVDDQPLLREGVTAVLTRSPDLTIVGEASDGREAIEKFRALQPDVTVMDLQMRPMSGIDAMCVIRLEIGAPIAPDLGRSALLTAIEEAWERLETKLAEAVDKPVEQCQIGRAHV